MENGHLRLKLFLPMLLCILLLFSAACGNSSNTTAAKDNEQQTEMDMDDVKVQVDSDGSGASVQYEGEEGESSFSVNMEEGVDIPKDYPSDIAPLYPNGTVTMSGKQGEILTVAIQTKDSMEDIFKFYEKNLKLDKVELKQQTDAMSMISGKAGSLHIDVSICQDLLTDAKGNLISISVTQVS